MEDTRSRYRLLSKPGILRILVIVYEHGPMQVHRLSRYEVGVGTAYRSAREAALMGLARLYRCGSSTCIELTERGRAVAKHLLEAVRVFGDGVS